MRTFYLKYCGLYIAINLALTILTVMISVLAKFELPSATAVIVSLASGFYPGNIFVRDNNRLPEKSELRRFALTGTIALNFFSAVFLFLLIKFAYTQEEYNQLAETPLSVVAAILVIVELIVYFVVGRGFGQGAKMEFKSRNKNKTT